MASCLQRPGCHRRGRRLQDPPPGGGGCRTAAEPRCHPDSGGRIGRDAGLRLPGRGRDQFRLREPEGPALHARCHGPPGRQCRRGAQRRPGPRRQAPPRGAPDPPAGHCLHCPEQPGCPAGPPRGGDDPDGHHPGRGRLRHRPLRQGRLRAKQHSAARPGPERRRWRQLPPEPPSGPEEREPGVRFRAAVRHRWQPGRLHPDAAPGVHGSERPDLAEPVLPELGQPDPEPAAPAELRHRRQPGQPAPGTQPGPARPPAPAAIAPGFGGPDRGALLAGLRGPCASRERGVAAEGR